MNIALIMYIVILMKTTSLSLCYVTAFGLFSSQVKTIDNIAYLSISLRNNPNCFYEKMCEYIAISKLF